MSQTQTYWQGTFSTGKTITRSNQGITTISWTNNFGNLNGVRRGYYTRIEDGADPVDDQLLNNANVLPIDQASYLTLDLWTADQRTPPSFSLSSEHSYATRPVESLVPVIDPFIEFFDPWLRADYFRSTMTPSLQVYGAGFSQVYAEQFHANKLGVWLAQTNNNGERYSVSEPQIIDTTLLCSMILVSSNSDNLAALLWHHNLRGFPPPEPVNFRDTLTFQSFQLDNDLYVVQAADGAAFDFNNSVNITKTIPPALDDNFSPVVNDTLRPFPDCDAVYVDDVLHVVFTTVGFQKLQDDWQGFPILTRRESLIWHWDSASDTLTLVANGWFTYNGGPGYWSRNVASPSIGVGIDGALYCIFRQVDGQDSTEGGYCLGDIWLSISGDSGETWSEPTPLVETPGVNEVFPSLAANVDENLHIQFLATPPTNQSPSQDDFEGEVLSVMYLQIPVADLPALDPLPMPRENFQYHNREALAVSESPTAPSGFGLTGAYPNPFNSETRITFSLDREQAIRLEARDLQGRIVTTLFAGKGASGENRVVWDAAGVPTGVYLIRLEGETAVTSLKVALIR